MKGATVERGRIKAATNGGYIVSSCDREGIETPPIQPIFDTTYTVGDAVYFFFFQDGTGKIICGL